MKLNHLNLTVTDVVAAAQFLQKYFGLHIGREDKINKNFTMLCDDNGMVLTLMRAGWPPSRNSGGEPAEVKYPGTFHIGFIQESEEQVNEIYRRLKDDGFEADPPQRSHGWTFYVMAPGGFLAEVLA